MLRDGRLQQVNTPQYLFESPVNLFVAGFIGSPAMNFVTVDLVRDGGPAVTFAGYKLAVPPDVMAAKHGLSDFIGKQVIGGGGVKRLDGHEGRQRQADVFRVEHRDIAPDHAVLLKPAYALVYR